MSVAAPKHQAKTAASQAQRHAPKNLAQRATASAAKPAVDATRNQDALVLDLAGRQRMLNQRHVKQVLARLLGAEVPLEDVRKLMRGTVRALAMGGRAVVKPGASPVEVELPPAPTPEIRDKLLEQERLLGGMEALADEVLRMDRQGPGFLSAVQQLLDEGQRLHAAADGAVGMLTTYLTEKQAANAARERLMAELRRAANQINETAGIVSETTISLSQNTQNQVADVDQVSNAMKSLEQVVEEVGRNAKEAEDTAQEATRLANEGGQAVKKNIEAIQLINQSSEQIAEILVVVAEISSQTNLLALNAAIEAARAGEHGAGFAVVADEVRKLAERASEATNEISKLVKESNKRVREGVALSEQADAVIRDIIDAVATTSTAITEIATAADSQSRSLTSVSSAVTNIARATESNAAASEELAASSEELSSQAASLFELSQG